jgi:predicted NAD/FAD-binding protein
MAVQTGAVVAQSDLQAIHELQAEINQKQELLLNMTENVKALLFAKASIEPGRFDARLSFKKMHNVAWKQIVIEQLGSDYAESVRLTAPTVTRCELVVIEHAIPPLWRKQSAEDLPHN